ncbi:MAG TPA: kelch repeat-containing protein [Candidatus Dormibacteraeota bacterium]|nr:kelch repeat-containing protein [Candidatus Dormibacteraeota bacterium]
MLTAVAAFAVAAVQPVLAQTSGWQRLTTTTAPSARMSPAMAYDPVSQRLVLFGGAGLTQNLNDTWTFDGTTWTEMVTPVAPPVRNGASMAYDGATHKLVMFGGFDVNHYLGDTWLWDGATSTWTEAQMTSPPPHATGAMLFTDPLSGKAMMFGGYNSFTVIPVYSTTWRWTGTSWKKLFPSTEPYPRGWGIAVPDPLQHNVVLTGGTGDTIRSDNTWTWDGHNWALLSPSTQIPAYVSAGSAFDPTMQAVIVLGAAGDTWSWSGTDWVQLTPVNSPPARSAMGMAYDTDNGQTIMFGGQLSNGTLVNDTWRFSGQ